MLFAGNVFVLSRIVLANVICSAYSRQPMTLDLSRE